MADYVMSQWPKDLESISPDIITPYPCQTCKVPFSSRKRLATHDCATERKRVEANA